MTPLTSSIEVVAVQNLHIVFQQSQPATLFVTDLGVREAVIHASCCLPVLRPEYNFGQVSALYWRLTGTPLASVAGFIEKSSCLGAVVCHSRVD